MNAVFVLWHARDLGEGETEDKLVGVYSSEVEAQAAIVRKLAFPGFRDHPDGFSISRYELNRDAWSEGFGLGED